MDRYQKYYTPEELTDIACSVRETLRAVGETDEDFIAKKIRDVLTRRASYLTDTTIDDIIEAVKYNDSFGG